MHASFTWLGLLGSALIAAGAVMVTYRTRPTPLPSEAAAVSNCACEAGGVGDELQDGTQRNGCPAEDKAEALSLLEAYEGELHGSVLLLEKAAGTSDPEMSGKDLASLVALNSSSSS